MYWNDNCYTCVTVVLLSETAERLIVMSVLISQSGIEVIIEL